MGYACDDARPMHKAITPIRHNLRAAAARAIQRVLHGRSLDDALAAIGENARGVAVIGHVLGR